jgi:hypothetical protein
MENKPLHYDGSNQNVEAFESEAQNNEAFVITDEMRKNLSGNPYMGSIVE